MSHSLTRIWIHTILGTKDHCSTISERVEPDLHNHIKHHLEDDFNCGVRAINGTANHVHVLFLLSPNYAIKDLLQNIKGESSHWVNQQNLTTSKFAWQTGYSAFSVSESNVAEVQRYIENQKRHHASKTYAGEYEELLRTHGLSPSFETVKTVISRHPDEETHD